MMNDQDNSVLLVDDEADIVEGLESAFHRIEWKTRSAFSGKEALSILDDGFRPSIVLLDIKMPGENGVDFIPRIRKRDEECCIIMLTGDDQNIDYVRKSLKDGACDYFIKPELPRNVVGRAIQKLREWTEKRQAEQVRARLGTIVTVLTCARAQSHGLKGMVDALFTKMCEIREKYPDADPDGFLLKLQGSITAALKRFERFSHVENPVIEEIDLAALVREGIGFAQELFKKVHRKNPPEVNSELVQSECVVWADRGLLEEVLSIMVGNALDACAAVAGQTNHRSVEVSLESRGDEVILIVTDDGPGFEPEALPRIGKEPYTTKRGAGGFGIGLLIASHIANLYGGDLSCENRQDQTGAKVQFTMRSQPQPNETS